MVQNIQICFGSGWEFYRGGLGKNKNYHLAFRHNSSAIYIHRYLGLDFEIANSYYFFAFAFGVSMYRLSILL